MNDELICTHKRKHTIATCIRCNRVREIQARCLCKCCHRACTNDGTLINYERMTHSRDEVLDFYALYTRHMTLALIAHKLGMTSAALDRALSRARRAKDPRATYQRV
jgi:hypothetical protein